MDDEGKGWISLGATDLGSARSVDYDPETGTITVEEWHASMADGAVVKLTRTEVRPQAYPAGTPAEDVLDDLMANPARP